VHQPQPVRAHHKEETHLAGHTDEDTAPPRPLSPSGIASAQPVGGCGSSDAPAEVVERVDDEPGDGFAAFQAQRQVLTERNAARRAAELVAATERERRWAA